MPQPAVVAEKRAGVADRSVQSNSSFRYLIGTSLLLEIDAQTHYGENNPKDNRSFFKQKKIWSEVKDELLHGAVFYRDTVNGQDR